MLLIISYQLTRLSKKGGRISSILRALLPADQPAKPSKRVVKFLSQEYKIVNQFIFIRKQYVFCDLLEKKLFLSTFSFKLFQKSGILFPKCSSDGEKVLRFETEGPEFANLFKRFLKQDIFPPFSTYSWTFLRSNKLEQL